MTISRVRWIIWFLAVGICLVAAAWYLGSLRTQQSEHQEQVEQQLALARQRLSLANNDQALALQKQLADQVEALTNQLNVTRANLVSREDSISTSDKILALGATSGVKVSSITSTGRNTGNLVNTPINLLPLDVQVSGNYTSLQQFVLTITREFPTCILTGFQSQLAVETISDNTTVARGDSSDVAGAALTAADADSPIKPAMNISQPNRDFVTVVARIGLIIYDYGGQ